MRDNMERPILVVGLTILILLFLHMLPPMHIGGQELRRVSILSDISSSPLDRQHDVVPKPVLPSTYYKLRAADGSEIDFQEHWPKGVERIIDFNDSVSSGMQPFYDALSQSGRRVVRIAYYGDSFIEGDVMTSDLRQMLQQRYGGMGAGWIDGANDGNTLRETIKVSSRSLAEHMSMNRSSYHAENTGISERYDDILSGSRLDIQGTVTYPKAYQWDRAQLFMRTHGGLLLWQNSESGRVSRKVHIAGSPHVQSISITARMHDVNYSFSNVTSHSYLYGVALEGRNGIVLDNFGMRGNAGINIRKIPQQTLRDFARMRPYDLIVLQYGMNAYSPQSTPEDIQVYFKQMTHTVENLRAAYPHASILLVGTPDRGQRTANGIGTMKGLPEFIAQQQQFAANMNVPFYNLFEAMGGEGAMGRMVQDKKAEKDYIHIRSSGGRDIARQLFNSINAGYANYKRKREVLSRQVP